jgi:hypothetical protein
MDGTPLYYPPRAGRFGKLRRYPKQWCERAATVFPTNVLLKESFLSLLITGFAFREYRRTAGNFAMAAYLAGIVSFFIWLGYPAGDMAFATLLSVHASSLAMFIRRQTPHRGFVFRIATAVAMVVFFTFYVYEPARRLLGNYIVPLRSGDHVIVAKRSRLRDLRRGDWVLYEIKGNQILGQARIENGYGEGPILAVPGDMVEFSSSGFTVAGIQSPLQPFMPTSGGFTVGQNRWFVWPAVTLQNGHSTATIVSGLLLGHSMVTQETYVGRPFDRWFWRKQTP